VQEARRCTSLSASAPSQEILFIFTSDRVQKLKDAQSEALKEIDEYKKAKEAEFKAFEASVRPLLSLSQKRSPLIFPYQHAGTTSTVEAAIDKETESKLKSITNSYEQKRALVINELLERVVLVKPALHRNLKKVS
jgi:V-type H+-transporting ATPase subunit G